MQNRHEEPSGANLQRHTAPQIATKRKAAAKRKTARYGAKSRRKVGRALDELKHGELKSGRSGAKVKSRKQAIAIGLSEARKSGGKVPPAPKRKRKS